MKSVLQLCSVTVYIALWTFFCCDQVCAQQHGGRHDSFNYSREFILSMQSTTTSFDLSGIPCDVPLRDSVIFGDTQNGRQRRGRKRGKRGGVQRRLRKYGLNDRRRTPPLPSVLLSNVQSIRNKTDELEAYVRFERDYRETCLLAFTETWLGATDFNHNYCITGFGEPVRMDRSPIITNKESGGGVCFYVNERYCNTVVIREKICTPDIELLSISLRPFYLPREFPQLFYTLVYIQPHANSTRALKVIADVTQRLDSISPDAPKFVLGDLNHRPLNKVLKTYQQYVTCATTQGDTMCDVCYGSVPDAYKSRPMPSFGLSYHNSVLLVPVYKPVCKRLERVVKTVKCWTQDGIARLQGCFDCTDWQVFHDACLGGVAPAARVVGQRLNELTDVISSYISFCVDTVIPTKEVIIYPNNKPWVTKELKEVLNKKKRVFYTGTSQEKKVVNREVRAAIRKAKRQYKDKVEMQYSSGDIRAAWQGIKTMASVNQRVDGTRKSVSVEGVDDQDLPNVLNTFYARFERHDFSESISALRESLVSEHDFVIVTDDVVKLFKHLNAYKAPGPDGICGRTLRYCAEQLGGVFGRLFQLSIDSGHIPSVWKFSNIIPVPKKSNSKQPNDFRPVALTSLVMKSLEKLIKSFVLSICEDKLDPLQFAYRAGRGVEDAKLFILNTLYKHLEKPKTHARMLFADFSSAFNTMQPHILAERLISEFELGHQLVLWILDFLTNRQQRVFVNGRYSDVVVTNTGSPQGCGLSPLLFIMYTNSCRSSQENSFVVKFSDDSAVLSLLTNTEHNHGTALPEFVHWCDDNFLDMNVTKTKEMIFDFRRNKGNIVQSIVHDEPVEIVDTYKYLGTIFDCRLKWDVNTEAIVKRGQQRMYLLRKLSSFGVGSVILSRFYQSFIESVLTFSFICWFRHLTIRDRNSLNNIVKVCSKITGMKQRDLGSFCDKQTVSKAARILSIPEHVLVREFSLLPSGRRYSAIEAKTNRYSRSFVPTAIRLLNNFQEQ